MNTCVQFVIKDTLSEVDNKPPWFAKYGSDFLEPITKALKKAGLTTGTVGPGCGCTGFLSSLEGSRYASIGSDLIEVVREVPRREFSARLFERSKRTSGVNYIQALLGDRFTVASFGHFILASPSRHSISQLKKS